MSVENPKYDVAISFLAKDEQIAAALDQKLRESLDIFFFPRRQDDLAGTDGMETMRTPFLEDSRVMVVLFREQWGKTRWTAIEEIAIKEACFNGQWKRLFFIALDRTCVLPKWLPPYYVRFNWEDFGIDQAVGAIKLRVLENGGKPTAMTPAKKAEMNLAEENYRRAKSMMTSSEGIEQIFFAVKELFHEICRLCEEVNNAGHDHIEFRLSLKERQIEQTCALGSSRVGMVVFWYQPYGNGLGQAFLGVRELNENMIVPTGYIRYEDPDVLIEAKYDPELSITREYGWRPQRGDKAFISPKELASQCVIQFLDLINRDASRKVHRRNR